MAFTATIVLFLFLKAELLLECFLAISLEAFELVTLVQYGQPANFLTDLGEAEGKDPFITR